ncbi:MAG: EAL domain-containing protein [Gammaproteobacteria bacterium]
MKKVLLIELSATLRHAARKLLAHNGYEVTEVSSFSKGLTSITGLEQNIDYDVVCLGWPSKTDDVADELFATLEESRFHNLSVVVLSHKADTAKLAWVTRRSKTALVLWENYAESIDAIQSLTDNKPQSLTWEPVIPNEAAPMRVLFVDDSPTVRVTYRRLLTQAGYVTDTASCVEEGMEKATANQYDIVITDYYMPDGTGDQLCSMLRDDPRTAHITTAIITGTYSDKAIIGSLNAGAEECMFKNEAKELFLARIDAMGRSINAMRNIKNDHKRLEGILRSVGDGVYGVNREGEITFINPAAKSILGYTDNEKMIGQLAHSVFHHSLENGSSNDIEECQLQKTYQNGTQLVSWATNFIHADGRPIPVECTVYPLYLDNKLHGSVVAFRDVTERKLLLEELKWQATHDPLTKLPNRSYFESQLVQQVKAAKESGVTSSLLYLDLDRFKYLNDTAGHNAGDKLLVAVGKQLLSALHHTDSLARIGGDEFAIIMRDVDSDSLYVAADRFRQVLDNYRFNFGGKTYKINTSIGVAEINKESKSSGEVLANADIACYIAKGKGRNQTHIFASENDQKAAMDIELGWSQRLHDALEQHQFVLHYQPIVPLSGLDVDTLPLEDGYLWEQVASRPSVDGVYHYEVLLRLPDSRGELICPEAFLPTAERFNMMSAIDRWVIRRSIQELANQPQQGLHTCLSINLSGQTLEDESLAAYIHNLVQQYEVNPQSLLFEVTETSAIANLDIANRFITSLRELGYQFSLDDFGSGFCSFSHLKYLPVDEIKIDGIFIQGMLHDTVDRAIIESIVQIAHTVGKRTVAEFVENAEILKMLKHAGVDYVQGYYVGRPSDVIITPVAASQAVGGQR